MEELKEYIKDKYPNAKILQFESDEKNTIFEESDKCCSIETVPKTTGLFILFENKI